MARAAQPSGAQRAERLARPSKPVRSGHPRYVIPSSVTCLPVGGMPISSPMFVPRPVQRVATNSPLGDLIVDRDRPVREPGQVRVGELPEAVRAADRLGHSQRCGVRLCKQFENYPRGSPCHGSFSSGAGRKD
jgi:hypothetical protein